MTAPWVDDVWLAVDTETTGIDVFTDRIVEVAAVEVHPDGTTGAEYRTIVNPGVEIPDGAAAVHGITTARAADEGIAPAAALQEVAARIFAHGHRPVVMFNARFDWPLLLCEAERHDVDFPVFAPVLDPFLIDRMVDQYRRGGRKLVAVAQHYAVPLDEVEAHGALADAVAAARVMRKIVDRFPKVGERSLASVYLRQVRGHERWRDGFIDYKRRQSDPDFYEPPGWPIPALIEGGLPVIENPTAGASADGTAGQGSPSRGPATAVPTTGAAVHELASPTEAEGVVDAPAPAAPDATEGPSAGDGEEVAGDAQPAASAPAITASDVARYATTVFRKDYDAAPARQKTKTVDRLRHALTYALTDGHATSLNDCTDTQLRAVMRWLRHIADQLVHYSHDDQGVTFVLVSNGAEHAVEWSQLEPSTAA